VVGREFQSTCLALRSPANKPGNPPPKQMVRSAPISGREGESYAGMINTGLSASMTWMVLAYKWFRPRKGTE
jgi:hypothetical protein